MGSNGARRRTEKNIGRSDFLGPVGPEGFGHMDMGNHSGQFCSGARPGEVEIGIETDEIAVARFALDVEMAGSDAHGRNDAYIYD